MRRTSDDEGSLIADCRENVDELESFNPPRRRYERAKDVENRRSKRKTGRLLNERMKRSKMREQK